MPSIWINDGSRSRSRNRLSPQQQGQKRQESLFFSKIKSYFPQFVPEIQPVGLKDRDNISESANRCRTGNCVSKSAGNVGSCKEYQRSSPVAVPLFQGKRPCSVPYEQESSNSPSLEILSKLPRINQDGSATLRSDCTGLNGDDLTCPICLEILHRPRELKCGHIFCLLCLQNYSNSCSKKFSCPSCRQLIQLPKNGVSDLPRNERMEKYAERYCKNRQLMTNCAKICFNCETNEGITECGHCGKGWCSMCKPIHATEVKDECARLRTRLEEVKGSFRWKADEEEAKFRKLQKKISDVIEAQIKELLNKKEKLTSEVELMKEKSEKDTVRISCEVNKVLSKFSVSDNELSWEEAGKLIHWVTKLIESASDSKYPRVIFDCQSLTLNVSDTTESSSGTLSRQNSKSVGEESDTRNYKEEEDDRYILPKQQRSLYRKKSCSSKYRWGHSICERPAGVAVSPWTKLVYVTGSDACKVYMYDLSGKQVGSFGSRGHSDGQFLCPVGIAFSQANNELYITDKWKHCIHVFNPEGLYLRQIGRKGKGLGQFSSPEGIATDSSGLIYVADTCNDRVQVLDSDGVFIREVGVLSCETVGNGRRYTKREFSEPVGLAASPDGSRIYVADSGNHRIRVFSGETGERILMFGSRGNNKGQFESPECLVVDSEGFIIVGDSGNGRVQIFKPNGHFARCLGAAKANNNNKGKFGWVSGVALTNNNEIIVTDFKNSSMSIL